MGVRSLAVHRSLAGFGNNRIGLGSEQFHSNRIDLVVSAHFHLVIELGLAILCGHFHPDGLAVRNRHADRSGVEVCVLTRRGRGFRLDHIADRSVLCARAQAQLCIARRRAGDLRLENRALCRGLAAREVAGEARSSQGALRQSRIVDRLGEDDILGIGHAQRDFQHTRRQRKIHLARIVLRGERLSRSNRLVEARLAGLGVGGGISRLGIRQRRVHLGAVGLGRLVVSGGDLHLVGNRHRRGAGQADQAHIVGARSRNSDSHLVSFHLAAVVVELHIHKLVGINAGLSAKLHLVGGGVALGIVHLETVVEGGCRDGHAIHRRGDGHLFDLLRAQGANHHIVGRKAAVVAAQADLARSMCAVLHAMYQDIVDVELEV